jgi:hypothetical protein
MTTLRKRLLPAFLLVICCGVVAAAVSRASANTKQDNWEGQLTEVKVMSMHLELYDQLIGVIQGMYEVADDASASGVLAVMSVDDHVHGEERIKFLNDMLGDTEDPTVRRAIRIKLIESYKDMGDNDEALEQIEALITAEDE